MRYAARAMRTIIVDFARERTAARRGGGEPNLPLLGTEAMPAQGPEEILTVHRALEGLAARDARMAEVVELRVLRRSLRGRDGGGAGRDGSHRPARLGEGPPLAGRRAEVLSPGRQLQSPGGRVDPNELSQETWSRVDRLLDQALDVPEAEREAWLASLAREHGRDVALVRKLLSPRAPRSWRRCRGSRRRSRSGRPGPPPVASAPTS